MDFQNGSYLALIGFLILTGCGLPLPEELAFIYAGLRSADVLNPVIAYSACLIGAIAGDVFMYSIGRWFGRRLLNGSGWLGRFLNEETEKRAEQMIDRHGLKVFLLARFLVGVRGPMYITSGILRIPFLRFLLIDGVCAAFVVTLVFGLSWYLGERFERFWNTNVDDNKGVFTLVFIGVALSVAAAWYLWKHVKRRRASGGGVSNDPSPTAEESATTDIQTR